MQRTNPAVPKDPHLKWRWIRGQLLIRSIELSTLAEELDVSRQYVQSVAWQPRPRVQKAIADKLGVPVHEIWPDRYDRKGRPLAQPGRPRLSDIVRNLATEGNGKVGRAA